MEHTEEPEGQATERCENTEIPEETVTKEEANRMVAEAEARGYLRGKNENAALSMHSPRLWENPCRTAMEQECEPDPANGFLSKIRPGVWD